MSNKTINTRLTMKHDIEGNWNKASNFIPLEGEVIIYDADIDKPWQDSEGYHEGGTHKYPRFKVGDGITNIIDLPFADELPLELGEGENSIVQKVNSQDDENFALGVNSIAMGEASIANRKAYYINKIDWENCKILLSETQVKPTVGSFTDSPSFTIEGLELPTYDEGGEIKTADWITILQPEDHLDRKRYITAINGNIITFNERYGTANEFTQDAVDRLWANIDIAIDDFVVFVPDKPLIGAVVITSAGWAHGYKAYASGSYSTAEGVFTIAGGAYSHAEGNSSYAGYSAHAEGGGTSASGKYSHTEGYHTTGDGLGAHAEGFETIARGDYSHSEGSGTTAGGSYSHTEGFNTEASGLQGHAEGTGTLASGINAHAEGNTTTASGDNSHAEGSNTSATRGYAHAEGYNTLAEAQSAHAEGQNTHAYGAYSHVEGWITKVGGEATAGHAEGYNTAAEGAYSHVEGWGPNANGQAAHAEGSWTVASAYGAHAEGDGSYATELAAHAEGSGTKANGQFSHSEGSITEANGQASHAEGQSSKALGSACHAEGNITIAGGYLNEFTQEVINTGASNAHAEGNATYASGSNSHTEGNGTRADGAQSHAGGSYCYANGENSFAHGFGCITNTNNAMVVGNYNVNRSDALFEVGNGTGGAVDARSNAFTVLSNGRAVLGNGSFGYITPSALEENALFFVLEEPDEIIGTISWFGDFNGAGYTEDYIISVSKGTTWTEWLAAGLPGWSFGSEYNHWIDANGVYLYGGSGTFGPVKYNGVNVKGDDIIHHTAIYTCHTSYDYSPPTAG